MDNPEAVAELQKEATTGTVTTDANNKVPVVTPETRAAKRKHVTFDVPPDAPTRDLPPHKKQQTEDVSTSGADGEQPILALHKAPQTKHILQALRKSQDQLMFIAYQPEGAAIINWYLVQAVMDEENAYKNAEQTGMMKVQFMVPHFQDSKKMLRKDCRYWPEIHHVTPETKVWGQMKPVRPSRAKKAIAGSKGRLEAYIDKVKIQEALLVGPFSYAKSKKPKQQTYKVDDKYWDSLKSVAKAKGIDASDIDQILPLGAL